MTQGKPPAGGRDQPKPGDEPAQGRKPSGQQWAHLIEERIREAQERGDFDNLPGAGKPLNLDENPYAGDRALAFHLLKSQNLLPRELELGREIDADLARAEKLLAEFRRRRDSLLLWQHAAATSDPLARWRLPGTSRAQQVYQTMREDYATRYEAALREIRSKTLTLNIIAPTALHRKLIDVEERMHAFYQEFPPLLR